MTTTRRPVPLWTLSSPIDFSRNEPGVFAPLRDALLTNGDYYMHLADLKSYWRQTSSYATFTPTRRDGLVRRS